MELKPDTEVSYYDTTVTLMSRVNDYWWIARNQDGDDMIVHVKEVSHV